MQPAITIRYSTPDDQSALHRLAALDDRPPIGSDALLAFVDGDLKAALDAQAGNPIADPFARTAGLIELLRLRLAQEPAMERMAA